MTLCYPFSALRSASFVLSHFAISSCHSMLTARTFASVSCSFISTCSIRKFFSMASQTCVGPLDPHEPLNFEDALLAFPLNPLLRSAQLDRDHRIAHFAMAIDSEA